ncbi:TIGR04222 domain-containing membrane protein [Streptomyces sp. NPDC059909]|uniref:TIGR04222 domain-containing membrane protein n=1 Tax=Streptomyces sp. NPDC059909 TaxID=3346998 RepID=UPI003665CE12
MPTDMWWFIGACGVLLAAAAALLWMWGPPDRPELTPQAVAMLRGGRRAALTVALVALHQRGAVAAGRRGTIRQDGPAIGVRDPLQLAAHRALHWPVGVRVLASRLAVRHALDGLRDDVWVEGLVRSNGRWRTARVLLAAVPVTLTAGLLMTGLGAPGAPLELVLAAVVVLPAAALWCVPHRTRAGRHLLASLRKSRPLPASRHGCPPEEVQLCVALYGDPALLLFVPHFARDGGLLGTGSAGHGHSRDYAARPLDGDWSGP